MNEPNNSINQKPAVIATRNAMAAINQVLNDYGVNTKETLFDIAAGISCLVVSRFNELPPEQALGNLKDLNRKIVRGVYTSAASNREIKPILNDWENKGDLGKMATQEHDPTHRVQSSTGSLAIDAAFVAGRDAIIKALGCNASQDDLVDAIQRMAHCVLTENKTLNATAACHNTTVFCEVLRAMVERTQDGNPGSPIGRLM